ncbi:deoxyribodipyrimidine photo-lyase [Candidatus Fermentibacteria bacterium]|nr:deoxyribodipyrimidine photo-lyase [Candidatus Fermentibacteria bacterium]
MQRERIFPRNRASVVPGSYVLYWMQAAQRAHANPALEYAIVRANRLKVPVVSCFGLTESFPGATLRHYQFMLEGLRETKADLAARGIEFAVHHGEPSDIAVRLGREACLVIADRGYLRIQRKWRRDAARLLPCRVEEIEGEVVVPLKTAYPKQAYSAAVLRPRIDAYLPRFFVRMSESRPVRLSLGLVDRGLDLDDEGLLDGMELDRSISPSAFFRGGRSRGLARLDQFISHDLAQYDETRNDPNHEGTSRLSAYLHFGQISSLEVALAVRNSGLPADSFLDELIVRRELACNYAWFNLEYDAYDGVAHWAKKSLARHAEDGRPYLFDEATLEDARTHDPYWNAAQNEMRLTGRMHGYMRMYWGKKLIEWCASPREAYAIAVRLNDRYQIDGRDPNGYAGIAWCFGTHDRPWGERAVFGSIRYMNEAGLRRKFDADAYVRRVETMMAEADARKP